MDDEHKGKVREVFSDIAIDPGETRNIIDDEKYVKIIGRLLKDIIATSI